MRKSSIEYRAVLTPAFRRIGMGGCLLYMAAYMSLSALLTALGQEAWKVCLAFVAGMMLSGPFNAYLGDTYRRKHVFIGALLGMLAAIAGYVYWDGVTSWAVLAAVQGACFGLASAAGVTVSIDITVSGNRTSGNQIYALMNRIGMFAGIVLGCWLHLREGMPAALYLSMAFGLIGVLEAVFVYVPFRAPIGVSVVNLDRFLLLRALLPAFNVLVIAVALGLAVLWLENFLPWYVCALLLVLPLFFVASLVKMFVKLSHHCQRGTGNTTLNLAVDAGWISGMAVAVCMGCGIITAYWALGIMLFALLLLFLVTYPYYRKKRVR